jgi:prepilin-type N-terminal cleavage/methylation domain-containing protein
MKRRNAFTIIELLVVVSIIALLIGILLPAIGKARERAHLATSQSNLRQLSLAHHTYGSDWNDNQWSTLPEYGLARFGADQTEALQQWASKLGVAYDKVARVHLGWNECGYWGFSTAGVLHYGMFLPISFESPSIGWGFHRAMNVENFNQYVSGRFYDKVFYAPKDRVVIESIGYCFDVPGAFCNPDTQSCESPGTNRIYFSTYSLAASALYTPQVFSSRATEHHAHEGGGFHDPWKLNNGLRVPTFSQALYPELKTHILEHHWLQNRARECIPEFTGDGIYNGCEPYLYNAWWTSAPATLFYDGHIEVLQVRKVVNDDKQARRTSPTDLAERGLWHRSTPLKDWTFLHYYHDIVYRPTHFPAADRTSYHVLTTDGIRGRDILTGSAGAN